MEHFSLEYQTVTSVETLIKVTNYLSYREKKKIGDSRALNS